MTRRLLSACVGAALIGVLSVPAYGIAKPPDLPEDPNITVKGPIAAPAAPLDPDTPPPPPETTPANSESSEIQIEVNEANTGSLIFGVGVNSNSGLTGALYQLRPTARRTLAGSLLFGIHPALGLLPTDKLLEAPCDHPQPAIDFFFSNGPHQEIAIYSMCRHWTADVQDPEWLKWLRSIFTARQLSSDEKENYLQAFQPRDFISGLTPAGTITNDLNIPIVLIDEPILRPRGDARPEQGANSIQDGKICQIVCGFTPEDTAKEENQTSSPPTIEILPMPREDSDITCPFLRQQRIDKHACQIADPEIGRDVLANLKSLQKADKLLELAKDLASDGFVPEAMMCCDLAAKLCPGSPCAQRAADTKKDLARGIVPPTTDTEESAEPQSDEPTGSCSQWDCFWRQLFEAMGLPLKNTISSQIRDVNVRPPQVIELYCQTIGSPDDAKLSKNRSTPEPTIEKKLDQLVSLAFANASLRQVLDDLRDDLGINIFVDEPAVAESGISLDTPINFKVEDIAYKSALRLLLQSAHLTYVVKDDVLKITPDRNFVEQYYKRPWDLDPNFDTFRFLKQQQHNWACLMPKDEVSEPGVEPMVCGLMKACHLLMSQGMQHQAAELARQAYALDPQRVMADPLLYKMHLLAETLTATSTGGSEESEPQTCPYCPSVGTPIREIVPEKKHKSKKKPTTFLVPPLPPVDYEVVPVLDNVLTESATEEQPSTGAEETSEAESPTDGRDLIEMLLDDLPFDAGTDADGSLRLSCECTVGDNVYHVRYGNGALAIWKTADASKSKDLRQIEYDRERIWFKNLPSHLNPEKVHGGVEP